MSERAIAKIRTWRRVIEDDAIEVGLKKPTGRLGQGHDHTMSASASLAHSRLGECQVYSGPRIPINLTYLTVECAFKHMRFSNDPAEDSAARDEFRNWVFWNLKSLGTFNRKLAKGHLANARLLIEALGQPDTITRN